MSGPTTTIVIGGHPLKGIYPFYPPSGKIRVAVTVFTYADQVHVTALAHRSLPNACNSLLVGMALEVNQNPIKLDFNKTDFIVIVSKVSPT